jgi:hypothetical protein
LTFSYKEQFHFLLVSLTPCHSNQYSKSVIYSCTNKNLFSFRKQKVLSTDILYLMQ